MKAVRSLQALLILLVLLAYILAVRAVELFGLKPIFGVPGLAVVVSVLWFVVSGKKLDQAGEDVQKHLLGRMTDKSFLGKACVLAGVALAVACALVSFSESLVLMPAPEVGEIEVFKVDGDNEESIGFASKDKPYRNRFFVGEKKFRFKSKGFQDRDMDVRVVRDALFGEEKHYVVELLAEPVFTLVDVSLNNEWREEEDKDLPEEVRGLPSAVLRFGVASPSPAPFEIIGLRLMVGESKEVEGWSFPYFGEPFLYGAETVKGYTILKPGKVESELTNVATVGAKRGSARYSVRLISEPARRYRITGIAIRWVEANQPNHSGETEITLDPVQTVVFRQDWKSLLRMNPGPVRILYNARIDRLVPALDLLKPTPPFTILIADPQADRYLESRGIKLPQNIAVLPPDHQKRMEKLTGKTKMPRPRARSFIAADENRLLLQGEKAGEEAELLVDEAKKRTIVEAYDEAAKQLLREQVTSFGNGRYFDIPSYDGSPAVPPGQRCLRQRMADNETRTDRRHSFLDSGFIDRPLHPGARQGHGHRGWAGPSMDLRTQRRASRLGYCLCGSLCRLAGLRGRRQRLVRVGNLEVYGVASKDFAQPDGV